VLSGCRCLRVAGSSRGWKQCKTSIPFTRNRSACVIARCFTTASGIVCSLARTGFRLTRVVLLLHVDGSDACQLCTGATAFGKREQCSS
jgi:hypothetical protein